MTASRDEHPKALILVEATPETATIAFAANQLGVPVEAIDGDFGVVLVDPKKRLYTVLVDASSLPDNFASQDPFRGPFSNPRIGPF